MKNLISVLVVAIVMIAAIGNVKGDLVIDDPTQLVDTGYSQYIYMAHGDNLMERIGGVDIVVNKGDGEYYIFFGKYVSGGIVFGGYVDTDNGFNGVWPGHIAWCDGNIDRNTFLEGESPEFVLAIYDPDSGQFALLNQSTGHLSFDENLSFWFIEDIEYDGVPGGLANFVFEGGGDIVFGYTVLALTTASVPYPADGATDIDLDVEFGWTGVHGNVHNVYFGDDPDDLTEVSFEQAEVVFDVQGLDWASTYYWRVDEVDSEDVVHTGRVWMFDTIDDCSSSIAGDVNSDCVVDLTDFAMIAQNWLQCTRLGTGACD